MKAKDFTHPVQNEEIEAIGGHYAVVREERMGLEKDEILFLICWAVVDRSCCGSGGCAYALVPGFIRQWKSHVNDDGRHVSRVAPITDAEVQKEIKRRIEKRAAVQQVIFRS